MKWIVVFLCSFLLLIAGDQHPNTNGPFGKRHTTDNLQIPYGYNEAADLLLSSTLADVATLNVSATVYFNGEEIKVTWTPLSTTCKDDLIGVYSIDIPHGQGKCIIFL
jgi:hypothetical protein